jgi:hypothetical protein
MSISVVQKVIQYLNSNKTNLRCNDVRDVLEDFGFTVKEGKKGNHRRYMHREIPEFRGANYDCGHGKNSKVLPRYIENVVKVLNKYEQEILEVQ